MKSKINIVLEILLDEVLGNTEGALSKMDSKYSMTWMYKGVKEIFPKVEAKNIKKVVEEVYVIKNRKYEIFNIAENKDSVFLELVESYPNDKGKVYKTPLVLVLYFNENKIITGRHYCDPNIYKEDLNKEILDKGFKKQKVIYEISEKGIIKK